MLNLVQHLRKLDTYETMKQVQGDKQGLFTISSNYDLTTFRTLDYKYIVIVK